MDKISLFTLNNSDFKKTYQKTQSSCFKDSNNDKNKKKSNNTKVEYLDKLYSKKFLDGYFA